jgi:hypothetical protein
MSFDVNNHTEPVWPQSFQMAGNWVIRSKHIQTTAIFKLSLMYS